jgi:hypothetical protein
MNRSAYSFVLDVDEQLASGAPLRIARRFTVLPTLRNSVRAVDAALGAGGNAAAAAEDAAATSSFLRAARAYASLDADAVSISHALHALGTASIGLEVSFLLCTVTFHANLAHSLTRSP